MNLNADTSELSDVLYHACFPDSIEKILEEGLKPGEDGYVHLCNSVESAAGFVAVRDFVSLKGISVKTEEGIETVVVDRQRHNHACVIAVSTVALDIDKLSVNERDASAVEAGALPSDLVSYRYAEPIAVQHVVYLDDVHRGEKRLHQCFEP